MAFDEYLPTPLQPPTEVKADIQSIGGALQFPYDQKGEFRTSQRFGDDNGSFFNKLKYSQPFNPTTFVEIEEVEGEPEPIQKIQFAEGFVIERLVKDSPDQVLYHKPNNNGEAFAIAENDAFYVEFSTTDQGEVVVDANSPKIIKAGLVVADENRFYPQVGAYAGQNGKFLYKLCEIAMGDTSLVVRRFHCGDNIHHIIERVKMVNLQSGEGAFYEVLKDYDKDTDTVNFRSIEQLLEPGVGVISPTASVNNTIAFRRVKELADYPQVRVSEDADAILVRGNGAYGSLIVVDCSGSTLRTLLTWEDGLITTNGTVYFEAGCYDPYDPYPPYDPYNPYDPYDPYFPAPLE